MPAGHASILVAAALPAMSASYDESRALEYVKFAGAAYCSQSALESWSCGSKCSADVSDVTVCNGYHVKAFVGKWEGKCLISFEGTSDITSAIKDLQFLHSAVSYDGCDGCKVHGGFLDEYNSVRGCVKAVLKGKDCPSGSKIRTTGHSLGAAMNSLAMMDLTNAGWIIEESYDFGKPRTGNSEFAAAHNRLLGDRTFRVTHGRDPVPQVPPDQLVVDWHFEHVVPEVYYPGKVGEGHTQCDDVETGKKDCVEQYWNLPIDLLYLTDHLSYMEAQTSIFGCENDGAYALTSSEQITATGAEQDAATTNPAGGRDCRSCQSVCLQCQACLDSEDPSCERCWQCFDHSEQEPHEMSLECYALAPMHEWSDHKVQCLSQDWLEDCRSCWGTPALV